MRASVTAIVVALLVVAGVARAQSTDAEVAAQVHLDRGVEAFDAEDYPRAHREFTAAQELAPDRANPYRWLALTEVQLAQCPVALGHIEAFLARVATDDARIPEMARLRELCERITRPREVAPAPARRRPITQRWWFWTAVAGGVAALATTIVLVTADDEPVHLPPIHCDADGCAP